MKNMSENNLTHFDAAGNAVMVDVSEKPVTAREATAHGIITMNAEAFAAVESGTVKKGDVLGVNIRPRTLNLRKRFEQSRKLAGERMVIAG